MKKNLFLKKLKNKDSKTNILSFNNLEIPSIYDKNLEGFFKNKSVNLKSKTFAVNFGLKEPDSLFNKDISKLIRRNRYLPKKKLKSSLIIGNFYGNTPDGKNSIRPQSSTLPSKNLTQHFKSISLLKAYKRQKKSIKGQVIDITKGGFIVKVAGLPSFLPRSFLVKRKKKKNKNWFCRSMKRLGKFYDFRILSIKIFRIRRQSKVRFNIVVGRVKKKKFRLKIFSDLKKLRKGEVHFKIKKDGSNVKKSRFFSEVFSEELKVISGIIPNKYLKHENTFETQKIFYFFNRRTKNTGVYAFIKPKIF
jgi:hypothetical protein